MIEICRMEHQQELKQRQAVVIGAGIAGLLATRVLAQYYEQVLVVERDTLPGEPLFKGRSLGRRILTSDIADDHGTGMVLKERERDPIALSERFERATPLVMRVCRELVVAGTIANGGMDLLILRQMIAQFLEPAGEFGGMSTGVNDQIRCDGCPLGELFMLTHADPRDAFAVR